MSYALADPENFSGFPSMGRGPSFWNTYDNRRDGVELLRQTKLVFHRR